MTARSQISSKSSTLDTRIRRFRIASRELFNIYFLQDDPWKNQESAWMSAGWFARIEAEMFNYMVIVPENISFHKYGEVNSEIAISGRPGILSLPAHINREVSSGYWDFDLTEIPAGSVLNFISFFDWSGIDFKDNEFVKVIIRDSPNMESIVGKQALVRPLNVIFERALIK